MLEVVTRNYKTNQHHKESEKPFEVSEIPKFHEVNRGRLFQAEAKHM